MALIEVNWQPSPKYLRSFGTIGILGTSIIAILLYLIKGLALGWCFSIVIVGFVIFISSRISLKVTKGIYISFTLLTLPIGMVVSFFLLGVFYYLVLTPIGLFFRLIGRDILKRKFEPDTDSYWIKRRCKEDLNRYLRQF